MNAMPMIVAPSDAPIAEPKPPVSTQPPTTAAMMYWNSSPTPWPAWVEASRSAIMMPVSAHDERRRHEQPDLHARDRDADVAGGVGVAADGEDPVADARAHEHPRRRAR